VTWAQTVLNMPLNDFVAFSGFATFAAGAGFLGGFRGIRRARLIEDVPTAKIRSAHQGYVELDGTARVLDGLPIIAPLSGVQCCWYSYKVERRSRKSWTTVEREESDSLFLVEDETGRCIIDPEGASVTSSHQDTWYGSRRPPAGHGPLHVAYRPPGLLTRIAGRTGIHIHVDTRVGLGGRYRYTESVILDGDPLYAVGHFKTLDELDHQRQRSEIQRGLLRAWKQDAAAMARFDRNGDGAIDTSEWDQARQQAAAEAAAQHAAQLDAQHAHTLRKPQDGRRPFLIANLPQDHLARRYRLQGRLGLGVFLMAGSVAVSLITTRFFA
jgi:hypothetical protein